MPQQTANRQAAAGLIQSAARLLFVPGWVIAIGIMMKGYADIGDGFSAGVIAALVVIVQGLAFGAEELEHMAVARLSSLLAFIGLALAYAIAFTPVLFGEPLMTHFPTINQHAVHFGALEFITPVLFDVAVFLVVYGFCVGAILAVARAEVRHQRLIRRARKNAALRGGKSQ